jgi:hypothetical protein
MNESMEGVYGSSNAPNSIIGTADAIEAGTLERALDAGLVGLHRLVSGVKIYFDWFWPVTRQ